MLTHHSPQSRIFCCLKACWKEGICSSQCNADLITNVSHQDTGIYSCAEANVGGEMEAFTGSLELFAEQGSKY